MVFPGRKLAECSPHYTIDTKSVDLGWKKHLELISANSPLKAEPTAMLDPAPKLDRVAQVFV